MAGVVCSEHDLLPEHTKEEGRCEVPLGVEKVCESSKEEAIANRLLCILRVPALVESLCFDLFMEVPVVLKDGLLGFGVESRVVQEVVLYFLILEVGDILLPQARLCTGRRRSGREQALLLGVGGICAKAARPDVAGRVELLFFVHCGGGRTQIRATQSRLDFFGANGWFEIGPRLLNTTDAIFLHHKKSFVGMVNVDLVGGIPSNHVQYGKSTARMIIDPLTQVQCISFVNDDGVASRNEGLYV